jgi:hypothetical protein
MLAAIPSNGPEALRESQKAAAFWTWLGSWAWAGSCAWTCPTRGCPLGVLNSPGLPGRDTSRTLWIIAPGHRAAGRPPQGLGPATPTSCASGRPHVRPRHGGRPPGHRLGPAASRLVRTRIVPPLNLGLPFVSDEEVDDTGISHVLKTCPDLLAPRTSPHPDGARRTRARDPLGEEALWLKFTVLGQAGPRLGAGQGREHPHRGGGPDRALRGLYKTSRPRTPSSTCQLHLEAASSRRAWRA